MTIISEGIMGKQLEEYSNTETYTQFKYTHADRSMAESIKEQIGGLGDKVKDMMKDRVGDNVSSNQGVKKIQTLHRKDLANFQIT